MKCLMPLPFQELLVDEMVAAVDAMSRELLSDLLRQFLSSLPATLTMSALEALGPLRTVLLPMPTGVEVLAR